MLSLVHEKNYYIPMNFNVHFKKYSSFIPVLLILYTIWRCQANEKKENLWNLHFCKSQRYTLSLEISYMYVYWYITYIWFPFYYFHSFHWISLLSWLSFWLSLLWYQQHSALFYSPNNDYLLSMCKLIFIKS